MLISRPFPHVAGLTVLAATGWRRPRRCGVTVRTLTPHPRGERGRTAAGSGAGNPPGHRVGTLHREHSCSRARLGPSPRPILSSTKRVHAADPGVPRHRAEAHAPEGPRPAPDAEGRPRSRRSEPRRERDLERHRPRARTRGPWAEGAPGQPPSDPARIARRSGRDRGAPSPHSRLPRTQRLGGSSRNLQPASARLCPEESPGALRDDRRDRGTALHSLQTHLGPSSGDEKGEPTGDAERE